MIRLNDITDRVQSYLPDADVEVISKAYVFSAKVHQGQTRLSGEPYLTHPLEVAYILGELTMDVPSVATGLLHDTVEDTLTTSKEIEEIFGSEISDLVEGVTKISRMSFSNTEERQAENFRKMIIAMAKDIRVLLIKLSDRLHNMRTIQYLPKERREAIAQETMDIYAPLANRLGIGWIKTELEDLAFKTLKPEVYQEISERLESKRKEIDKYSKGVLSIIEQELKKNKIEAQLQGRVKHLYGIYSKMRDQEIAFEEVYDKIAFRIIVQSLKDCYGTLGIIHSLWKPVPGRFKDYIAMPKPNMYQSLHTTVIGPSGERIEVQIRTEQMHKIAQKGIAAHWRYKAGKDGIKKQDAKSYDWLQRLIEWQQDLKDPSEFLRTVKVDLFPEEVYVFTPKGEVKAFPRGATPIDFAYGIHTDVGNRCVGAKINGKLVPIRYQLVNGDVVEIVTGGKQKPSKDWLRMVVTSKAKQKIKHWLINEQKERSVTFGKEILDREFRKFGLSFQKHMHSQTMKSAIETLKTKDFDDLLSKVANARISPQQVIEFFVPKEEIKESEPQSVEETGKKKRLKKEGNPGGVLIKGVNDIMTKFAQCCNPVPGDQIIGFITRGRGVTIHTADCPNVIELSNERLVDVQWDTSHEQVYNAKIEVICENKKGVLASIAQAIANSEANISEGALRTMDDNKARCEFELQIKNLEHLKRVIRTVEKEHDVISVHRIT
jgi:GTP diphosphokinase / guanosine-3',5'-bis(diphosphate) 3'-diphosphatase